MSKWFWSGVLALILGASACDMNDYTKHHGAMTRTIDPQSSVFGYRIVPAPEHPVMGDLLTHTKVPFAFGGGGGEAYFFSYCKGLIIHLVPEVQTVQWDRRSLRIRQLFPLFVDKTGYRLLSSNDVAADRRINVNVWSSDPDSAISIYVRLADHGYDPHNTYEVFLPGIVEVLP